MPSTSDLIGQRIRVIFSGIAALMLTVGVARFAYTPLLPVMQAQAGLTDLWAGWLATFNYLGYISGALLAASVKQLSTKFWLYRLWLVVALVTTLMMALTTNPWVWSLSRFFAGLSATAGLLLASGLVLNWLIRHDFRPELGLHFTGMGLGIMLTGLATALMNSTASWDFQWLVFCGLALILMIPAWFWMPKPAAIKSDASRAVVAPPSRRWMVWMIAAYFCAGVGYVVSATFIVALLERLPDFSIAGGWAWLVVGLAAAPSSFLWDRIVRRIGDLPALMLCYALQLVSFLIPVLTEASGWNLLGAILYGNTFIGIVSMTLTLIGRYFPENPARAMARLTISYGVAQVFAPALVGYLLTTSGSFHSSMLMAVIVMGIGIALLWVVWRESQVLQTKRT